jgi:hypothetical protein
MNKQEQQFFEYFDQWQALADKHEVSVYQIVNARQIWDYAYTCGKADGVAEVAEIFETKESN